MALDTVTRSRLDYIFLLKQSWPHLITEVGKGMTGKDHLIKILFLLLISTEKLGSFFAFIELMHIIKHSCGKQGDKCVIAVCVY